MAGIDLDQQHVEAADPVRHDVGHVKQRRQHALGAHGRVNRELGEFADPPALAAQQGDLRGKSIVGTQALGTVERHGDRADGRLVLDGGEGEFLNSAVCGQRDIPVAAPAVPALEQAVDHAAPLFGISRLDLEATRTGRAVGQQVDARIADQHVAGLPSPHHRSSINRA